MGHPKKRRKQTESVRFSGSSSPNQLIEPSRKKRNAGPVIDDGDSDVEQLPTPSVDVDATTSGSVSKSSKVILTDAQELSVVAQLTDQYTRHCQQIYPSTLPIATRNNKLADMEVSGTGDIDPREMHN
ncbi:hypothetical protein PSHT_06684 [Puccinia striiformis]|uniref:Uncharacterized protein n=1 Tax=Puccinia striiformis TaxID=27350 RepID=A0A2S4W4R9_9BASI|nr:hypothetical protein PSHT_06684 [Puccinia striiformis]